MTTIQQIDPTNPDPIDSAGYRIWDEFYTQMERRVPGYPGRKIYWQNKYYKTFRKIAKMCLEHQIDLVDFVVVNLELLDKNHRHILPSDLATSAALQRYIMHKKEYGDSAVNSWATQLSLLVDIVMSMVPHIYKNETDVLLAPNLPLNAWFRVLYPQQISETDEIFVKYGKAAWNELKQNVQLYTLAKKKAPKNVELLEKFYGKIYNPLVNGE